MKILVTGGSGYIGSYLVSELLLNGHYVTSIDIADPVLQNSGDMRHERFNFIKKDVSFPEKWGIDIKTFDAVIPLAAIVGRKQCEADPKRALRVNHSAIVSLIDSLGSNQIVIFPQTNMGFIQNSIEQPHVFTDNTELKSVSWYVETKMRAEQTALKHEKSISLRLSSVFGVSNPMKDHLLLNFMVKKAVQENIIELYEPDFFRSFVSLKDLSNLIEEVLTKNHSSLYGQKVNVSDPRLNVSKMEIAKWIQAGTGCEIKEIGGSDPDKRNYIIESELLDDFNFSYKSDLPHELIRLIDFFRKSKEMQF